MTRRATAQDVADLQHIRQSPEFLRELPEAVTERSSEAAVVHALLGAGLAALRERAEAVGYAALAEDEEQIEHHAALRAGRNARHRPASADDE